MTNQSTIDKLIEMRLTAMADAFRNQLDDPKLKEIPFEDQFGMLVDIEYSSRKNNRLKRLIKNAGFDQPEASIVDINYTSGRRLNKELIRRLATCEYISEHRNLFITGATGCGKTYMACAFGMEACKQYLNTVSAKYSCGFPDPQALPIIVVDRYLDYFTTIMEDRLWQVLAKPVFRWRNRSGLSMNAARAA